MSGESIAGQKRKAKRNKTTLSTPALGFCGCFAVWYRKLQMVHIGLFRHQEPPLTLERS